MSSTPTAPDGAALDSSIRPSTATPTAPDGAAPDSSIRPSTAAPTPTPDGAAAAAATPDGAALATPTPDGATPGTPTPDGATPGTPTPDGATPATPTPDGAAPATPTPNTTAPAQPPATIFSRRDPNLVWINRCPYLYHSSRGSGAYGTVYELELLAPLGFTVVRDLLNHDPCYEGDGTLHLRPMSREELAECFGPNFHMVMGGYDFAWEGRDPIRAEWLNCTGCRCAMKRITVGTDAAFRQCLREVKMMDKLKGSEHIVRIYASEVFVARFLPKSSSPHLHASFHVCPGSHF